jgi:hypothetical protein
MHRDALAEDGAGAHDGAGMDNAAFAKPGARLDYGCGMDRGLHLPGSLKIDRRQGENVLRSCLH